MWAGDGGVVGGGEYGLRAWLDPDKTASRARTAGYVVRAMRDQNVHVSAGQLGAEPMPDSDFLTLITAQRRLHTEQEFGNIVLEAGDNGEVVRLSTVARLALGAGDYPLRSTLACQNALGLGLFKSPCANALAPRTSRIAA